MFNLNISFFICNTSGVLRIMYLIKTLINVIRFIVPIILIIMLIYDLPNNVIKPNEKDGINKIVKRVVAAVIVFIVPTVVSLVISLIDYALENGDDTNYKLTSCYTNANMECIKNIEAYLNCDDISAQNNNQDRTKCQNFRRCNSYELTNSCSIKTTLDNLNCREINYKTDSVLDTDYTKYSVQGFKLK